MQNISNETLLEYCLNNKKSLTPTRVLIINTLSRYKNPRSAYDILDDINSTKDIKINISTIYRVLEFWMRIGLVHKISLLNKFLICIEPTEKHVHMLNFCTSCEKVFESCSEKMGLNIKKGTSNLDLSLDKNHSIEIPVICSNCN